MVPSFDGLASQRTLRRPVRGKAAGAVEAMRPVRHR
jgi:hypothetical protein